MSPQLANRLATGPARPGSPEQRWRILFADSPLSVQVFAPDGWSREVNTAWQRLFNMSEAEAARVNLLDDPQIAQSPAAGLVRMAFEGRPVTVPPIPYEVPARPGDPRTCRKWIGASMFPLLDEWGKVAEVICIHQDFTGPTAELAASEARWRTLVDHAPEAIVVFDAGTGRFVSCNQNALRFYGLSLEELVQVGPADVSPERQPDGRDSGEAARELIDRALAGETPVFDWIHRHADGHLVPCEVRLVRLPGEGRPLLRASILDNTERKRKEKIQQATYEISEAVHDVQDLDSLYGRIHSIIKRLMPAGNFYIALYDPATEILTFPYYVDEMSPPPGPLKITTGLTGYVLRTGEPLLAGADFDRHTRRVEGQVLVGGDAGLAYVECGAPAAVWLGVPLSIRGQRLGVMAVQDYRNARAYAETDKQILTFVGEQTALAIDRKQAEAELVRALTREKELSALKSNFTAMVSHEFRTPLGIIMSSAEILETYFDQLDPADRNEHLRSIQRNTRRMADLMEEVLLLAQVEAGKLDYHPRPLDFPVLCRRLTDEITSTDRTRTIRLSVAALPGPTLGDERLLRHIFINLLSNAVKYSAAGSSVGFEVTAQGAEVVCTVSDQGIGIPPEDRQWLFRPFHRGRNVDHRPGTGLGLVIVKRCVELHQGTITVESTLGQGTTFRVQLPLLLPATGNLS